MSTGKSDLLLELGCEELPASFVEGALEALPSIAEKRFGEVRLGWTSIRALGTPRRLALIVEGLDARQSDLEEELTGPPVKAAFKDGAPTRAAQAFAEKLGVTVDALRRVDTPKGEYLAGTRREKGQPTAAFIGAVLTAIIKEIPFRKSMRWADLDFAFGRPIQWVVALLGEDVVSLEVARITAGRVSRGHRFISPDERRAPVPVEIASPASYVEALRRAHVLVDPKERLAALESALRAAAQGAGGSLIEDTFLMGENLTLVEEPHVIVGRFEPHFLELPERVILEVAKGHQRYFGMRDAAGKLLPNYLAVVNTALDPASIQRGNDNVMRARLADARFFYKTDLDTPLAKRREKLAGVVFQKRLGSVLEKADRVESLAREIGLGLGLAEETIMSAVSGAHLAKCDLVALMVGEFPELQGEMGRAYALAQGVSASVADVIADHYRPKGASDDVAPTDAGALVAIADRLDTLVGCFAIGQVPTGTADPFGLRRACLGILRTCLERSFDVSIEKLALAAHAKYANVKVDQGPAETAAKVGEFVTERLRGLLADKHPADAVRASIGAGADRPLDVLARVRAIASLDDTTRARMGEVFKRATNIAKDAEVGEPTPPTGDAHASEAALYEAFTRFRSRADELAKRADYVGFFGEIASIAPVMERYFLDVFVMCDDLALRANRLRLMRSISDRCARVAKLELLAAAP
ncbi:MAG: glycine--tRNA ligase subunit beta [Polyangiaceae bacterium]